MSAPRARAPALQRDHFILPAFVLAVASRLMFVAAISSADYPYRRYLSPANEFLRGHLFSAGSADQLPGAPLFFAFCLQFVGENFSAIAALQHLLGLATWFLIVRLADRAGGRRAARWTAWLFAIQMIFPFEERFLLSETTAHFLFAAALNLAADLRENPRADAWRLGAAGGVAALAALTRGELLVLGPLVAVALSLPRRGRSLIRAGAYLAAWGLTLGLWLGHNRLAGSDGFNALGSSLLIDTALPLVRYDLPTNLAVKNILREEAAACLAQDALPGGCARLQTVKRIQADSDPKKPFQAMHRAQFTIGAIAREAIWTQPLRYAALVRPKFLKGLTPIAWVDNEQLVADGAVTRSRGEGGWRAAFWSCLERGPQYFGWVPLLLIALSPLGLLRARPQSVWLVSLLTAVVITLITVIAPADMSARLQASIYLPLCVLGGLSADYLSATLLTARPHRG